MITAIAQIAARRAWFVPDFVVWGLPVWEEIDFLTVEQVGSDQTILYGTAGIGDSVQEVAFGQLIDHRGNHLPATIESPRVIVRPRSEHSAFVAGDEVDTKFKIARGPAAAQPVTVDLYIIELGS